MAKQKWQVAGTYTGWVQAGKKGPEAKCAAHWVATGRATQTACGAMPVRGTQPSGGFTHYGLHWYEVNPQNARMVCRGCQRLAQAAANKPVRAPKPVAQVPTAQVPASGQQVA